MKFEFSVILDIPDRRHEGRWMYYSHIRVVATSEAEARQMAEQHLAEKKPLGFSEREIRRMNPKRTPWKPGVTIRYIDRPIKVSDDRPLGVVCD